MDQKKIVKYSIRNKMLLMATVLALPFLCMTVYLIFSINNYSEAYDRIVSNMTVANNYNINFKEEMDESLYKLVVGYTSFDRIGEDPSLEDPYQLIYQMKDAFQNLMEITGDKTSRSWLMSLLRNMDTLENRVDDIKDNLEAGDTYDVNIEMLDNNIYILTELIQDDIQYYIYYQTVNMEKLKSQLDQRVHSFLLLTTVLIVILIMVALVWTILTVRSIAIPIKQLTQVTEKISGGDFSARAEVNSTDETMLLAQSVNEMGANIEALVQKIKEDERKMRHADLRLLQEQINPHFLYNTLDTIVWLIEGNETDKAENMVMSLSEFFRLVLSKGKEYISIQDEELHIRSYLEIQKVRYNDIMDYEIEIDPEIYQYRILKLTLQPLVENSLYHGIKYKRAKGTISVRGFLKDGLIHLLVKDNGVGMSASDLEKLRQEISKPCQETEKGFGLANVNERIRMNFGQEYGMTIDSKEGEGTTVSIVIPAQLLKEQSVLDREAEE